jgi:hypothetical protein
MASANDGRTAGAAGSEDGIAVGARFWDVDSRYRRSSRQREQVLYRLDCQGWAHREHKARSPDMDAISSQKHDPLKA